MKRADFPAELCFGDLVDLIDRAGRPVRGYLVELGDQGPAVRNRDVAELGPRYRVYVQWGQLAAVELLAAGNREIRRLLKRGLVP